MDMLMMSTPSVRSELGHAVGQGRCRAAGAEVAGAGRDQLGAGRLTVHRAAEQRRGRDDAGDVRAVLAGAMPRSTAVTSLYAGAGRPRIV